jgi:ABC-type multidrug transport system fused ATPase/permease subunit
MSRSIQRPLTELMLGVGLVGVLLYGGLQSIKQPGYIHNFLAFVGALGMLYGPLRAMMGTTVEMSELLPSAERTFEVLDLKPVIAQAPDAIECPKLKQAIEFKDVTFEYPGRGNVFEKLNLTIHAGEKIGIVGPTGVGKSTLLSLLMRFYDPIQGQVSIDGVNIKNTTLSSLRAQMAFVNQRPFLFHDSVMENIRYGRPDATDEEVMEAAKKAMVHDEIMAQPEGYKTLCGERGGELFSGGQGQRICVARAILRQASILLLDEATSSLDTFSERRVQEALDKLVENCTSVIVAHRLSTLRNVNRLVVFGEKGGIEAIGPHDELLKSSVTYRKLWSEQSGAFSAAG